MTTATQLPQRLVHPLDIGGMTCASCVGRVEKALHRARRRQPRRGQPGHRGRHRRATTRPVGSTS